MKNNKNYCKFVSQVKSSQVKSSQVKSSAKIVSLIALLFLLLFSISCKSKQNPNGDGTETKFKPSQLVGNWKCENSDSSHSRHYIVIEDDGHFYCNTSIFLQQGGYYYIPNWNDIKDKEYTNFIVDVQGKGYIFSFNSSTSCIHSNKNNASKGIEFYRKE